MKSIFLIKNYKNSLYYRKCIGQTIFLAVNLILGYIFGNKTEKQNRQMVSDKIWYSQAEQNIFI